MIEEQAKLVRCSYRSAGTHLTQNILEVHFKINGEYHSHLLPNAGWGYQTPALAFLGYIERRPSDFNGDSIEFEEAAVPVVNKEGEYHLSGKVLTVGSKKLAESDWFTDEGDVWDGVGNMTVAPPGPDPGTGNRGGVPVDGEK